jgi:hypothetical protein
VIENPRNLSALSRVQTASGTRLINPPLLTSLYTTEYCYCEISKYAIIEFNTLLIFASLNTMPSLKTLKSYTSLPQTDVLQNDLEKEGGREPWGSVLRSDKLLKFWIGSTISFAILSTWLALQLYLTHKSSFATGYDNELREIYHLLFSLLLSS